MERIVEYFRSFEPISDEAWAYFRKHLNLHHHKSGEIIHPVLQPCNKIGFILQGVARSYLHKPDGRDFTWFFHYDEGNSSAKQFILIDYPSFNLNVPSTYGFQALSHCHIAWMTYNDLKEIFQQFPELQNVEKQLVISSYQYINQRLESLLTRSAKGRLEDFVQKHRALFDVIPHYYIASFLGISPQRLCQLRRG
jgi:CRP-like cAMP-binding protein